MEQIQQAQNNIEEDIRFLRERMALFLNRLEEKEKEVQSS